MRLRIAVLTQRVGVIESQLLPTAAANSEVLALIGGQELIDLLTYFSTFFLRVDFLPSAPSHLVKDIELLVADFARFQGPHSRIRFW